MTNLDTPTPANYSTIETVYKKWHKTGFISVGLWYEHKKVMVEVGRTDQNDQLLSATKCYVPMNAFVSLLYADLHGLTDRIYPKFSTEGYSFYGGGPHQGGFVSRVVKIEPHWKAHKDAQPDTSARTIKCGHFEGTRTATKAIKPNRDKPAISSDQAKLDLADLSMIYHDLNTLIIANKTADLLEME